MDTRRSGRLVRLTVAACVLLIIGALVLAWWQRPDETDSGRRRSATPQADADTAQCGTSKCDVIDTAKMGGETVELLSSPKGKAGKLRVKGAGDPQVVHVSITRLGVRLSGDALECVGGDEPACVVTGPHVNGVIGEVFVAHGGTWDSVPRPYFSNADEISLHRITDAESPNVVVVEHECDPDTNIEACRGKPVVVKVYGLDGKVRGCTKDYPWPARIPGWPEIDLAGNDLGSCD